MTSSPSSAATSPRNIAPFPFPATRRNTITVALSDPSDLDTIDSLHHLLHADIELKVASEEDIEAALNKYYGGGAGQTTADGQDDPGHHRGRSRDRRARQLAATDEAVEADAPIIKLVNTLIVEAFKMRASDIHLEPLAKTFRVRYRIDGVLQEMKSPPKRLQASIISRLKIQSNMSIAEHRIPQDGRIQTQGGRQAD